MNTDQQVQRAKRDKDVERAKEPGDTKRGADDADLTTTRIEEIDAVRAATANEEEESHEDRQEHGFYDPHGATHKQRVPRLDLEG